MRRRLPSIGLFAARWQKIRKTFPTKAEARSWQADAKRAVDHGALRAPTRRTLAEAASAWIKGAESGDIRNRSGQAYKPATLRGYGQALDTYVLPVLGGRKLSAITTSDLQWLVDSWQAKGTRPRRSAIRSSPCRRSIGGHARERVCPSIPLTILNCRRLDRRRSRSWRPRRQLAYWQQRPPKIGPFGRQRSMRACATESYERCDGAPSIWLAEPSAFGNRGIRRRARFRRRRRPLNGPLRCRDSCGVT